MQNRTEIIQENSKSAFYRELENLGNMKDATSVFKYMQQNKHIVPYIGKLENQIVFDFSVWRLKILNVSWTASFLWIFAKIQA